MNAEQEHPMQKVFLLTSAPAHQNGIGSIFLRDILAAANHRYRAGAARGPVASDGAPHTIHAPPGSKGHIDK